MAKKAKTTLEEETVFKGNLAFSSSLCIKGRFDGSINSLGSLFIEKGARVTAEIKAKSVQISGEVTGNIIADDMIEMTTGSILHGNIRAKKIKIADGVVFDGVCEMIT